MDSPAIVRENARINRVFYNVTYSLASLRFKNPRPSADKALP